MINTERRAGVHEESEEANENKNGRPVSISSDPLLPNSER